MIGYKTYKWGDKGILGRKKKSTNTLVFYIYNMDELNITPLSIRWDVMSIWVNRDGNELVTSDQVQM